MRKILRLAARTSAPAAAILLVASFGVIVRAKDKAQLNGHWNFNVTNSDDAQQKVDEAQQNSKIRSNPGIDDPSNGGGYPGTGGPYPGGGYPGGGIGRVGVGGIGSPYPGGGMGRGGRQSSRGDMVSSEDWERLAANPQYLSIEQHSDRIVVMDDAGHTQSFYTDGKKHDDKDADGRKVSTKASWEGDAFVAESKLSHSEKLTQTFRASQDGKQLYVTSRFEAPSLAGPLSIRRVYDLSKTATPAK